MIHLSLQIKGVLPTDKDLASADALLKRAIDTNTLVSLHSRAFTRILPFSYTDQSNLRAIHRIRRVTKAHPISVFPSRSHIFFCI
jgi:hypothetical protein